MSLPTGYDERKNFPLWTVLTAYFPDAIEALVALSVQGNIQHAVDPTAENPHKLPSDTVAWDRRKSKDELNTLARHLWDHTRALRRPDGPPDLYDTDGILHIVKAFWRAGAEAQKTIEMLKEKRKAAEPRYQLALDFSDEEPAPPPLFFGPVPPLTPEEHG
jgi:hypothetical protein